MVLTIGAGEAYKVAEAVVETSPAAVHEVIFPAALEFDTCKSY